jgi:hypothetical protein
MVFLQAIANPSGASRACFAHVRSGTLALFRSPETVAELRGLLARPNIRTVGAVSSNSENRGGLLEII